MDENDPILLVAYPRLCPICAGQLRVDEEYMLSTFGPSYVHMNWQFWTFWCEDCDEAGPWIELQAIAQRLSGKTS